MISKYHNHTLQTNPWHGEKELQNIHSNNTSGLLFSGAICAIVVEGIMKNMCVQLIFLF